MSEEGTEAVRAAEQRADVRAAAVQEMRELRATVEANTAESVMLRHDVQSEREARRWKDRLLGLVAAVAAGLLFAAPFVVFQVRANHRTISGLDHTVEILVECTTPDNPRSIVVSDRVHECYDQSLRNQQQAVMQIVDANHNGVYDTQEILDAIAGRTTTTVAPKH